MMEEKLYIYNTITEKKEAFNVKDDGIVKWYCCGPTVYDDAHIGHARTYVTFDIIRRIMEDELGFNIFYAMNITDIDDKIIIRGRQKYLIEMFWNKIQENPEDLTWITKLENAIIYYSKNLGITEDTISEIFINVEKQLNDYNIQIKKNPTDQIKIEKHKKTIELLKSAIITFNENKNNNITQNKNVFADILGVYLDNTEKYLINNNTIFLEHTKYYETRFFQDMDYLGVKKPDIILRVSEYIPEIIKSIHKIQENSFSYDSENTIYFDTTEFEKYGKTYIKLRPSCRNDKILLKEGEGQLTSIIDKKKSNIDFALWKKSKIGEPKWESPWGEGRPGWHIECSAMCCSIFGSELDIHSGGIDLAFPHHDNEIAQCEAMHINEENWPRFFIHSGHLNIKGLKMSKSLKNFITIREIKDTCSPRTFRMLILMHSWTDTIDYHEKVVQNALREDAAISLFISVMDGLINENMNKMERTYYEDEMEIDKQIQNAKQKFRKSLLDSFDTAGALKSIKEIVNLGNVYIKKKTLDKGILIRMKNFVVDKMKMFGCVYEHENNLMHESQKSMGLELFSTFRDKIRKNCLNSISNKISISPKEILELCDNVRKTLAEVGVMLNDRSNTSALITYVEKEIADLSFKKNI